MKMFCKLLLLLACTALVANAQDVIGDWQGTLKAGGAELRLVLHISKAEGGALKATMDSVDQGANGIPVSAITIKDSQLNFTVDAVHGAYEGKLNAAVTEIAGTWTQGQPLPLVFDRTTSAATTPAHKPAKPSDIDGTWMGTLDVGMSKLRVVFHLTNTEDGLTATLDSPDQNAKGLPVTSVTRDGALLKIEVKSIGGRFEGKIASDLTTIDGTWTQGGSNFPLILKRVKDAAELQRPRPQNPVRPYPYGDEEVSYRNHAASIELAATLTIPPGKGPFPAALLITGSGPQDRDEALMGHRISSSSIRRSI